MIQNVDPQLSQWDVGRVVSISDSEATHIHFANQGDSKAVIIKIENGSAKIPDYLLQTGKTVIAYAVYDGVTLESKSFAVRKRERPENYVYEDDQRNYIYELITDAETAVASANTATENANVATGRANTAATNADVAINSANLATTNANNAAENANLAAQNVNVAVTKANNAVKNMMVVGEAKGATISLNDAIDQTLVGLRVFGKTTQDGTPTPDAPVELVSVGDSGSITINVNNAQRMTIATPNGLPGIKVTSGGNYTDANGQQWVCDEIDLGRGVYVQRVLRIIPDKAKYGGVREGETVFGSITTDRQIIVGSSVLATHLQAASSYIASSNQTVGVYAYNETELRFRISGTNTTDEISGFIANNSVEFYCVLATPIETPMSQEELAAYAKLHTYKDNTTVSNDAGAWMNLEYVMDAKKYIDSLVIGGGSASAGILNATVE